MPRLQLRKNGTAMDASGGRVQIMAVRGIDEVFTQSAIPDSGPKSAQICQIWGVSAYLVPVRIAVQRAASPRQSNFKIQNPATDNVIIAHQAETRLELVSP
ncbi:uncharacterized protein FOMMEDRAFT_168180 [Fomitiporia mediterranea MF3/22]|uniref:uncharacterized protein n=1 Tax=Fomitiporia mediterranea (strain MF3/22) TaxID=694068 RepID=UPI0004409096|nr:uncharacterized protein FOMMEDRAFT_168180 [Fomitiporia mediterranea MF3/22]EJD03129.1 hypothetical protein FOMMEDRAFT_168180 [Fomitiporia mediterranea MF3/22]